MLPWLAYYTVVFLSINPSGYRSKSYGNTSQNQNDVFVIVTDEEVKLRELDTELEYSKRYLSPENYKKFQEYNFTIKNKINTVRTKIEKKGATLENLRTSSMACSAVRTSLQTGHFPTLHGVWQTEGIAKSEVDVARLSPDDLPTMGHYFTESGYETVFVGKAHFIKSGMHIRDNIGEKIKLINSQGKLVSENVDIWSKSKVFKEYGYSTWFGIDGEAADLYNTGLIKDRIFVKLAQDWLSKKLDERKILIEKGLSYKPIFMALNVINPHDICLFPAYRANNNFKKYLDKNKINRISTLNQQPVYPSDFDTLVGKPSTHKDYRDVYTQLFVWPIVHNWIHDGETNVKTHRQYYNYFLNEMNEELKPFLNFLENHSLLKENSYVLMTSDHGDAMGTRQDPKTGRGLFQKWHNYYAESTNVPTSVYGPGIIAGSKIHTHMDTSDIPTTLFGLAELEMNDLNNQFSRSFKQFHKPVGHDYSKVLLGLKSAPSGRSYYITEDHPSMGNRQKFLIAGQTPGLEEVSYFSSFIPYLRNLFPYHYTEVQSPVGIEGLVSQVKSGKTFKIARYYYTEEQKRKYQREGWEQKKLESVEWEFYNLDNDPFELRNLNNIKHDYFRRVKEELIEIMIEERERRALIRVR